MTRRTPPINDYFLNCIAFSADIGFLFTGSITASGGIAIVGSITGFIAYFAHELAWAKVA